MQKGRVMLRAAGGIPYELTRGRVKRLNLHVRRDGTVALSIPLRTTLEAADAYVIAEAEWIRAAQARQAAREKRQEELPDKAIALAHFTAMSDKVYPAFAGVLGGRCWNTVLDCLLQGNRSACADRPVDVAAASKSG